MTAARVHPAVRDLLRAAPDDGDGVLLAQFVAHRDEAAFAALVRRHGAMVWDICRSVVGNRADADDAFQAVFLTLARRAARVRKPGSLGAWLFGVAVRIARKARAAVARRRECEANAEPLYRADESSWAEVRAAVHEALAALPRTYRDPLVACYLRGLTHDAAAAELGLSRAAVKKRLERGRDRLRAVLLRRGFGPAVVLAVEALPARAVPISLHHAVLRTAVGTPVPAAVLRLVDGGFSMTGVKLLAAAGVVAVLGFALVGGRADPAAHAQDRPGPREKGFRPPVVPAPDLAGEWTVKTVEANGAPLLTPEGLKKARVVFEAGRAELTGFQFGVVGHFAYTLDPAKTPKEIDIVPADGPLQGKKLAGIYAATGTELRVCARLEQTDRIRPRGFATVGGAGLYTMILERAAPPAPPAPPPPALRARLALRGDPTGPGGDRAGFVELANESGAPVRVTLAPGLLVVKVKNAAGAEMGPPDTRMVELDPRAERAVRVSAEIPVDGYVGFTTAPGGSIELLGIRGNKTDVHIGGRIWRLPAGRYTVEGTVQVTLGADPSARPLSLPLHPSPFTIP